MKRWEGCAIIYIKKERTAEYFTIIIYLKRKDNNMLPVLLKA